MEKGHSRQNIRDMLLKMECDKKPGLSSFQSVPSNIVVNS